MDIQELIRFLKLTIENKVYFIPMDVQREILQTLSEQQIPDQETIMQIVQSSVDNISTIYPTTNMYDEPTSRLAHRIANEITKARG